MRRPRLVPLATLLLLPLAGLARPASADDPPAAAPSPAAHFADRLSHLPAPTAELGLAFEGSLDVGTATIGTLEMKAEPTGGSEGARGWRVVEHLNLMGGQMRRDAEVILDAHLLPLRGKLAGRSPQGPVFETSWTHTDAGFVADDRIGEGDGLKTGHRVVAHQGPCLVTLTSMLLFARLSLPGKGTYEATLWNPEPKPEGDGLETAELTLGETGDLGGRAVTWLDATKGEGNEVRAAYAAEGKDLLELHMKPGKDAPDMIARPGPESGTKTDFFGAPAPSAQRAALTTALALGTADMDLLAKIVHWPTVHARMQAAYDAEHAGNPEAGPYPDVDTLEKLILAKIARSAQPHPRLGVEAGLRAVEKELVTRDTGNQTVEVVFPATYSGLVLEVGEVDGKWYLVSFPRK